MQRNLKRLLVVAAALAVLWTPIAQAQQIEILQSDMQTLRWKNGDVLPGKLLESASSVGTQAAGGLALGITLLFGRSGC